MCGVEALGDALAGRRVAEEGIGERLDDDQDADHDRRERHHRPQ